MGRLRNLWRDPRRVRWVVMAICFALGLLVGWLVSGSWLERWSGINL